jgi:hypothetical protein
VDALDLIPLVLLALLGGTLGIGLVLLGWMLAVRRQERATNSPAKLLTFPLFHAPPPRPSCWLAIRSASPEAVRRALGLQRTEPCSWAEGLAGEHEFFISPRIHDWVIVTGLGLPHPGDDVDATFLFLTALSKDLGHVQFFHADRLLHHHAWARLDDGCVTRAYAWAGETVWQQGIETVPEIKLGVKLFGYGDNSATQREAEMNFEKVPALAARWSLDPAKVRAHSFRQASGIVGETAWL